METFKTGHASFFSLVCYLSLEDSIPTKKMSGAFLREPFAGGWGGGDPLYVTKTYILLNPLIKRIFFLRCFWKRRINNFAVEVGWFLKEKLAENIWYRLDLGIRVL